MPTGFYELDRMTSGCSRRPDHRRGTSVDGQERVRDQPRAVRRGELRRQGVVFSLEMSGRSLVLRMLCGEARVDGGKVRTGYLGDRDFPRLAMAAGGSPTCRSTSTTPRRCRSRDAQVAPSAARARRRDGGLDLIVVDLQLMRAHSKTDNHEQEISLISRSLKALAKELSVPVIALSQLNRAVESRADKRPMMSDLRESGAIEQDADVIAFVYRDDF